MLKGKPRREINLNKKDPRGFAKQRNKAFYLKMGNI